MKIGDTIVVIMDKPVTHYVIGFNDSGEPITSVHKPVVEKPVKSELPEEAPKKVEKVKVTSRAKKKA